jgi:hypothetical protein
MNVKIKKNLRVATSIVALCFAAAAVAKVGQEVNFTINNNSDKAIVEIHFSGSSDPSWGENILEGTIAPNDDIDFTEPDLKECEYDIQFIYSDGDTEQIWNQDLCKLDELTVTDDNADQPDPIDEGDGDDDDDDDDDDDGSDDDDDDDADDEGDDDDDDEGDDDDDDDDEGDDEDEDEDEDEDPDAGQK